MNYYNEFDPKAAAWLRELIKDGLIPAGDVDTRSITEVQPHEIQKYTQCHFFAGIGGWSLALELAGWPADRPVWTGSCPCQPFSVAGKRKGEADVRHLWPDFERLIRQCRPPVVFGEQVAGASGRVWLARVRADLEELAYAVGCADLCAAGIAAPHIRQRHYWVADRNREGCRQLGLEEPAGQQIAPGDLPYGRRKDGRLRRRLAHGDGRHAGPEGLQRGGEHGQQPQDGGAGGLGHPDEQRRLEVGSKPSEEGPPNPESGDAGELSARVAGSGSAGGLGLAGDEGGRGRSAEGSREGAGAAGAGEDQSGRHGPARGLEHPEGDGWVEWRTKPGRGSLVPRCPAGGVADGDHEGPQGRGLRPWGYAGQWSPWARGAHVIDCTDGKKRRIVPSIFPLADGVPGRVGLIRGAGNAIVPPLAAQFIGAYLDTLQG